MQSNPISVTLSIGSAPYQKRLAATLLRNGMLRRVLRFGPDLEVLDPTGGDESLQLTRRFRRYKFANRLLWAGWTRLPGVGRSRLPVVATSWLADHLAAKWIPPSSIFHGWTGVCLASLEAAKRQGAITLVENPMLHPQHWQREVLAECKRFGVRPKDCDVVLAARHIRYREREFEACDSIVVNSSVAHRSFEELGYGHKATVVWPGVDHLFFASLIEPTPSQIFRVCYVGRVELAKGIGYLLQAWKRLSLPHAELVLIGEIRPEMDSLLKSYVHPSVRMLGFVPPQEVAEIYRRSSVFVFPSVNEGLALVLLEAMASGLAVIATDKSGAGDCVTDGQQGFVVPARSVDALAEAILWCYRHQEETIALGRAAKKRVEGGFTLAHYEQRQIDLYHSLVARKAVRSAE
jgi:glycosyltransferase involved in cell wall biosynthesis